MKRAYWLPAAIVCCTAVLAFVGGCHKDAPATPPAVRQSTPEEFIETEFALADNWDDETMLQLTNPDEQYVTRLAFSLLTKPQKMKSSMYELASAIEKAYGKEGKDAADRLWKSAGEMPLITPSEVIKKHIKDVYAGGKVDWDKVKIYADGDTARVVWPGQQSPTRLLKIEDKWYETDNKTPTEIKEKEALFRKQIDAIDECVAKMDKIAAGVKAGDMSKEVFASQMMELGQHMVRLGRESEGNQPSAPQPKPKIADLASALAGLKSADVFQRGDAINWLRQAKIILPSEREALLSAITQQRAAGKEDLTEMFCQYAGDKQIPELTRMAESREGGQWQPALTALFRLSPQAGRTVVKHRATDWTVRGFASNLFRKDADRYADEPALLLDSPNPDLQRDMVSLLAEIGTERAMPRLRELKARIADQPEQSGLIMDADRTLQTIRQRAIDHGKSMPPEPTTPLPVARPVVVPDKPKFADVDAALAAMRTRSGFEQREAVDWISNAVLKDEDVPKVVSAANEARKIDGMNAAQITSLFLRYAGAKNLDDIESMTHERNNTLWVPAFRKLYRLAPAKAHAIVLARGSDFFFRIDLFKEFAAGGAIYEDELILCLQSLDGDVRSEAVKLLGEVGTSKSISPLSGLKLRTNLKRDPQVIEQIDQAIKAIQWRAKTTTKPAPGK